MTFIGLRVYTFINVLMGVMLRFYQSKNQKSSQILRTRPFRLCTQVLLDQRAVCVRYVMGWLLSHVKAGSSGDGGVSRATLQRACLLPLAAAGVLTLNCVCATMVGVVHKIT